MITSLFAITVSLQKPSGEQTNAEERTNSTQERANERANRLLLLCRPLTKASPIPPRNNLERFPTHDPRQA
jgi:hypothetical protein